MQDESRHNTVFPRLFGLLGASNVRDYKQLEDSQVVHIAKANVKFSLS